jgi:hypothetical protein
VEYVQGKYNPADVLSRPPHELGDTLPDVGQGISGHPSSGSPALLLTETAHGGPNRSRSVNPPAAREGCVPGLMAAKVLRPQARFPTCTPGAGVALSYDPESCAPHDTGPKLVQLSTPYSCRPARVVSSVTAILLNAVNPVTYHPVLPLLTGGQAREWWRAAYNSDHLFRDHKLMATYTSLLRRMTSGTITISCL